MRTVKVVNDQISLPPPVANWIGAMDELSLFIEGDTLILKKMRVPRLSEIAARAPEGDEEIPLEEIVAEVHRYRREKRDAGRMGTNYNIRHKTVKPAIAPRQSVLPPTPLRSPPAPCFRCPGSRPGGVA